MKIKLSCMKCQEEYGHPDFKFYSVEMNNDAIFYFECSKGHLSNVVTQNQKFELLFFYAAMALIDGYPREAITSTASSLERFYEYYINLICMKNKINIESFDNTWKEVNNQSERQFGAYLFTYLIENKGKKPILIDNAKPDIENLSKNKTSEWKSFRNNVVHKGYMPTILEAKAYMKLVYEHMQLLIDEIKMSYKDNIINMTFENIKNKHSQEKNVLNSTMYILPIFNFSGTQNDSFEKKLESLEKYKELLL